MILGRDQQILKEVEGLTEIHTQIVKNLEDIRRRQQFIEMKLDEWTLGLQKLQTIVEYDDIPIDRTFNF